MEYQDIETNLLENHQRFVKIYFFPLIFGFPVRKHGLAKDKTGSDRPRLAI